MCIIVLAIMCIVMFVVVVCVVMSNSVWHSSGPCIQVSTHQANHFASVIQVSIMGLKSSGCANASHVVRCPQDTGARHAHTVFLRRRATLFSKNMVKRITTSTQRNVVSASAKGFPSSSFAAGGSVGELLLLATAKMRSAANCRPNPNGNIASRLAHQQQIPA